jgi:hypothetical protein
LELLVSAYQPPSLGLLFFSVYDAAMEADEWVV